MIGEVQQQVAELVSSSASPAVLCSFGTDSLLLLRMALDVRPETVALWYRTGEDEYLAKKVIRDWNVTTFSYPPADVYLLMDGANVSLVQEFGLGMDKLPVIRDIEPSDACIFKFAPHRLPTLFLPFDTMLVGWRDADTHWTRNSTPFLEDGAMVGRSRFYAPLRHMTDDEVRNAAHDLNIPYRAPDDSLKLCTRCLAHGDDEVWCPDEQRYIPRVKWDAQQSLRAFRERFRLEDEDGKSIQPEQCDVSSDYCN